MLTLASILTSFSATQGAGGWTYGQYTGTSSPYTFSSTGFACDTGNTRWAGAESFSTPQMLSDGTCHPGIDTLKPCVRRFTVTGSGQIRIAGTLKKGPLGVGGDGITGKIVKNGSTELYSQAIAGTDTTGVSYSIDVTVADGDTIDFAVFANSTSSTDQTYFDGVIQVLPPGGRARLT